MKIPKIKLSFKKDKKPTGLYSVGHPYPETYIKIGGKEVGYISPPSWETDSHIWKVRIAVKKDKPDNNPNCDWRWAIMGKKFDTESDARIWIKDMIVEISEIYKLHYFED